MRSLVRVSESFWSPGSNQRLSQLCGTAMGNQRANGYEGLREQ